MTLRFASALLALALLTTAQADWTVDNDASRLAFVSTKAGEVAEVHRFGELSGWLGEDGRFRVTVALDSVDTAVAIRDERMREFLFETDRFPEATITAQLDMATLADLAVGDQVEIETDATLGLHGATLSLDVRATAARLDAGTLLVTSSEPLVVNAGAFDLLAGIEKLREIAGLASISPAVPVSFRLTLRQDEPAPSAVSRLLPRP